MGATELQICRDLRENWLWGPFFLVNVSIFFFIADQLVFKLKLPKPAVPEDEPKSALVAEPKPVAAAETQPTVQPAAIVAPPAAVAKEVLIKNKILIHFDQWGPWGQLKTVSTQGLRVHCLNSVPANIEKHELELQFKNGLYLKSRFKASKGREFYFEFTTPSAANQKLLLEWIGRQSA